MNWIQRVKEQNKSKIFGLSSWKNEIDIFQDGKDFGKIGSSVMNVVKFKMLINYLIQGME